MFCRFCGVELPDDSQFCSKCGKAMSQVEQNHLASIQPPQPVAENKPIKGGTNLPYPGQPDEREGTTTESANATAGGCLYGLGSSGCLVVLGLTLSATGIGAIIGIPMLLGALVAPFIGWDLGKNSIKGPCPYCGYVLETVSTNPGVNCPSCKRRILVREKKFYKS